MTLLLPCRRKCGENRQKHTREVLLHGCFNALSALAQYPPKFFVMYVRTFSSLRLKGDTTYN
ncbi:hypothetical protein PcaKH16_29940 [Parageobacillus caldoxylosilyticus]|nr:hypothetical protein PcaKH16_29940 [Parageobacillus caldoxylosilyticus]